ncbi:MAG: helix-turn-helix transcriptional regulator, partial [Nocardioides sp.]
PRMRPPGRPMTTTNRTSRIRQTPTSRQGETMSRRPAVSTTTHLTVLDLCAELGVARSTFYDWRARGAGPRSIKLPNGEIRVRRADLDTWLTGLEEGIA